MYYISKINDTEDDMIMREVKIGKEVACQGCERQELALSGFTKAGCHSCLLLIWQGSAISAMLMAAEVVFQTYIN